MRIGIDLGGTKTEIICLDDQRHELYRHRVPSPQNDYQQTIATIVALVRSAEEQLHISATVGIGIPGSINQHNQLVKNSNSLWINGKPFIQDLQQALGRDIRAENDANCFTLSEATNGAAAGADSVFGVILGTGCGGGLIINGELVIGAMGLGGEWGHNPLPFPLVYSSSTDEETVRFFDRSGEQKQSAIYKHKELPHYFTSHQSNSEYPGPRCYCGKRGCLETWISGTGFANDYYRINGTKCSATAIVNEAETGQEAAIQTLDRYYERVAKSLAQVVNIIDPDIIVLGGGMSNISSLYSQIPLRWDKYVFSEHTSTTLVAAKYGDSSGVRGAALLWPPQE